MLFIIYYSDLHLLTVEKMMTMGNSMEIPWEWDKNRANQGNENGNEEKPVWEWESPHPHKK